MKMFKRWVRANVLAVGLWGVLAAVWMAGLLDAWKTGLLMASTSPGFASVPPSNFTPQSLASANTAVDGTGTSYLLATAPATASGGSLVERVRIMHLGTNATATVVRIFLNNGSTPTVAGNNALIAEKTIPVNTLTQTAESVAQDIILNQVLKASTTTPERLYATIGTAANLKATAIGGDL